METIFGHTIWSLSYLIVLIGLSAYGIHRYSIIYLFLKHRRRKVEPRSRFDELPHVTVQLPLYNEYYVARRLLTAVGKLDYPKERLQIQVLDDSTDESVSIVAAEVEKLRKAGLDIAHIRRPDRIGYKAGALEYGTERATGEFIFILDADFVPQPDLLRRHIHHFTDPKLGMLQMRWGHLNRKHSMLTRLQALFLDGHLLLEQTARCRSGRFFNFNGTAGIWRKTCIEDAGGWQHDTLTEDLDLSYRAQLKGWRFEFLPDVEIPAELPVDMNGFKSQQHRWTKGSIQTCMKLLPTIWRARLPLLIKIEATMHLTSNFGYLLLALLCLMMLPKLDAPTQGAIYMLLVDLPIFVATTISISAFYLCAQIHLNPSGWWKDLWMIPMLLALAIGMSINNARGVLEALFRKQSEFTRTPKYGLESLPVRSFRYLPLRSFLPAIEIAFAAYFAFCTVSVFLNGNYLTLPFMLLFLIGFLYVPGKSIAFWLERRFGSRRTSASALPA